MTKRYGDISLSQRLSLILIISFIPFVALVAVLTAPWGVHWQKPWSRILTIRILHYVMSTASTPQLQWLLGTSLDTYTNWSVKNSCEPVVDEIGEGSRLLWLGERRCDRVILYVPGGAFVLPVYKELILFMHHLQNQISDGTPKVGVAILDYSLIPCVDFPTQLRQANAALSHLFVMGVAPQNLQIIADSAGGNIILQALSHALHPLDYISPSPLAPMLIGDMPPLRGLYLLAPFITLGINSQDKFDENGPHDFASASAYRYWGSLLPVAPPHVKSYVEASVAPLDWFDGTVQLVDRMLVTAAQYECLRDHIIDFCRIHLSKFPDLTFILVEGGIHGDPILTAEANEGREVTQKIVKWLKEGFDA